MYELFITLCYTKTMARKTISMTDEMEGWVAQRVKSGQYNNDSEYFRDLVRRDQERERAYADLRLMLEEAHASGISEKTQQEIWQTVQARHGLAD